MSPDAGCKVDRVIERYGLAAADPKHDHIDEGLLARWTGESERTSMGYRPLTEWFNKRLLRRVFDEHGRDSLAARLDHDYEALTGDDDLLREEVLESLATDGIDANAVREDFVSWGTMRTHLKDCLDGEKPTGESSGDWERDTVEMAKRFAVEKTTSALSSLATKDELDGVERSSVTVQIQLDCEHCPTRVPFRVALERGYICEQHADTLQHDT
jgi:hypothetical protein